MSRSPNSSVEDIEPPRTISSRWGPRKDCSFDQDCSANSDCRDHERNDRSHRWAGQEHQSPCPGWWQSRCFPLRSFMTSFARGNEVFEPCWNLPEARSNVQRPSCAAAIQRESPDPGAMLLTAASAARRGSKYWNCFTSSVARSTLKRRVPRCRTTGSRGHRGRRYGCWIPSTSMSRPSRHQWISR